MTAAASCDMWRKSLGRCSPRLPEWDLLTVHIVPRKGTNEIFEKYPEVNTEEGRKHFTDLAKSFLDGVKSSPVTPCSRAASSTHAPAITARPLCSAARAFRRMTRA